MSDDAASPTEPSDAEIRRLVQELARHFAKTETPFVANGRDADVFKRSAGEVFDHKIQERGLRSDSEIREIARDVSREVFRDFCAPFKERMDEIEDKIATFLPREEIKKGMLEALAEVGLQADGDHKFETRTRIQRLFNQQDRRTAWFKTLKEELWKGVLDKVINWVIIAVLAAVGVMVGVKLGGMH